MIDEARSKVTVKITCKISYIPSAFLGEKPACRRSIEGKYDKYKYEETRKQEADRENRISADECKLAYSPDDA